MHDRLREHVRYADDEPHLALSPAVHGVDELLAEREDLLGVARDDAPGVGEHEVAALAHEQLRAEHVLEAMDLPADRRVSEAQHATGFRDAAFSGDDPEIEQVVIVQPVDGAA